MRRRKIKESGRRASQIGFLLHATIRIVSRGILSEKRLISRCPIELKLSGNLFIRWKHQFLELSINISASTYRKLYRNGLQIREMIFIFLEAIMLRSLSRLFVFPDLHFVGAASTCFARKTILLQLKFYSLLLFSFCFITIISLSLACTRYFLLF